MQHNPRRVPKLLNWKRLLGGFKYFSQLYNPRCRLTIETWINKSSLHSDHTNAKFDHHLPNIGGETCLERLVVGCVAWGEVTSSHPALRVVPFWRENSGRETIKFQVEL